MSTIWTSSVRGLSLIHRQVLTPQVVSLLEQTVWGEDIIKYRVLQVERVLRRILDPHYLTLESTDGDVVAAMVCGAKTTSVAGRSVRTIHISMLAVHPEHSGKGLGGLISRHGKEFLFSLIGHQGIVYAYVEATHHQSIDLHERLGYRRLCDIIVKSFIRINPEDKGVRLSDRSEREEIIHKLSATYRDHVFCDFEQSVQTGEFFLIPEKPIFVGAQATRMNWSFEHIGGIGEFIAMRLLPHLPMIEDIVDPHDLHFIRIGNVLFEDNVQKLGELFEGLLSSFNVHMAMMFLDERSAVNSPNPASGLRNNRLAVAQVAEIA